MIFALFAVLVVLQNFGQEQLQDVAAAGVADHVDFVDDDQADFMQSFLFQKAVEQLVGFFDRADGDFSLPQAGVVGAVAEVAFDC